MRLSRRQKFIAATSNLVGLSRKEVKEAKTLARGHYWSTGEFDYQFCSYSPSGKRKYFGYFWFDDGTKDQLKRWKSECRLAARLWAQGKYKESNEVYALSDENARYKYLD